VFRTRLTPEIDLFGSCDHDRYANPFAGRTPRCR
jgi:hypothetical protein